MTLAVFWKRKASELKPLQPDFYSLFNAPRDVLEVIAQKFNMVEWLVITEDEALRRTILAYMHDEMNDMSFIESDSTDRAAIVACGQILGFRHVGKETFSEYRYRLIAAIQAYFDDDWDPCDVCGKYECTCGEVPA